MTLLARCEVCGALADYDDGGVSEAGWLSVVPPKQGFIPPSEVQYVCSSACLALLAVQTGEES